MTPTTTRTPPPAGLNETPPSPWPDPAYVENRNRVPYEKLQPWEGQQVAWSWDGTAILAGAPTLDELFQELTRLGIDSSRVVFDYVDVADEANW